MLPALARSRKAPVRLHSAAKAASDVSASNMLLPRRLRNYKVVFAWHYKMELRPHPPRLDEHYLAQLLDGMREYSDKLETFEECAQAMLTRLALMASGIHIDANKPPGSYKVRENAFLQLRDDVSACLACGGVFPL